MKHLFITIITAFALLMAWGCDDFFDVNHDPNALKDIPDAKVLVPTAEVNLASNLMGWDFGFGGGFWVEYWTQNYTASQFKSLCEYQPESFDYAYENLAAGVLKDCDVIKKKTAEEEGNGFYYIAEALSIFTWQVMTDVWGDIPYSEALKADEGISSPKFDKGQDIYADLMKRIDALLALDISKYSILTNDAKYDFVFNGDMKLWKQFANSLKLKLMIRLSETPEYSNDAVLDFIKNNELLTENAQIDGSYWSDGQEGKRHPMREFQQGSANNLSQNVIACKTFIDYLSVNSDPRLKTLFSINKDSVIYKGAFFGDFDSKLDSDGDGTLDAKEKYAQAVFNADQDIPLISAWEVAFYVAEVYARASNPAKAKEYYEAGVKASLAQQGITDLSILADGGYAKWVDKPTVEGNIKQIAMQRWVAHANYQHVESFLERNRTKYPSVNDIDIRLDRRNANDNFPLGDLTISVNGRARTNATLPQSPIYPVNVLTRNTNAPAQKDDVLQKVWWNKKAGK